MTGEFVNESSDGPSRRRTIFVADDQRSEATKRGIIDYARTRGWHLLDLHCYSLELPRSIRPDGILFNLPEVDQQQNPDQGNQHQFKAFLQHRPFR